MVEKDRIKEAEEIVQWVMLLPCMLQNQVWFLSPKNPRVISEHRARSELWAQTKYDTHPQIKRPQANKNRIKRGIGQYFLKLCVCVLIFVYTWCFSEIIPDSVFRSISWKFAGLCSIREWNSGYFESRHSLELSTLKKWSFEYVKITICLCNNYIN